MAEPIAHGQWLRNRMKKLEAVKRYVIYAVVGMALCVALSLLWHVPYLSTAIGFSAWAFFGHLVTFDDDAPGGWSNPDGRRSRGWLELGIKAVIFGGLCVTAAYFPIVRDFGGGR
jgi:hypothetical protein